MHDLEHAESLIEITERDLTAIRGMSDEAVFASPIVGFHVQQATEKLLKAWLAILGIEYPLTHSIARLLRLIGNQDLAALQFEDLHEFSPYAGHFRYESVTRELSKLDREAAIARIDDLMRVVRARLDSARGASES